MLSSCNYTERISKKRWTGRVMGVVIGDDYGKEDEDILCRESKGWSG